MCDHGVIFPAVSSLLWRAVLAVSFSPPKWYNFCTRSGESEAIVCLQISKNNFCLVPEIRLRQCRTFVNQKIFQARQPRWRPLGGVGCGGDGDKGMGRKGRGGGEAGRGGGEEAGEGGWGISRFLKYFRLECLAIIKEKEKALMIS